MKSILKLMRPKQWLKNAFVGCALLFSGHLFDISYLLITAYAVIAFCFISSSVYIVNDIMDREKDRMHEEKKNRPIASGKISIPIAIVVCIVLIAISVLITVFLIGSWAALAVLISYFAMNMLYCVILKHRVIVDVMCVALGFVLRAVMGGFAIGVSISPWLLVCAFFVCLYMVLNKRKNELLVLDKKSKKHRPTLGMYDLEFITYLTTISSAATLISYALFTILGTTNELLIITNLFVLYGIARYEWIVTHTKEGGTPHNVLLSDIPMLICIGLYGLTYVVILYIL